VLHDLLAGVVRTGEAFWGQDLLFMLERHGFVEETYFDVSYDPVRVESGGVGGVYCIVTETTDRVVSGRRMALLRDLAARQTTARTTRDAFALAMETLASHGQDIVFALAYSGDELQGSTPGAQARLAETPPHLLRELPLFAAGADARAERLVVGLNPQRPLDDQYRAFLDLVASQLDSALANARAYEEERLRAEALSEIDRAKTAFFSNVSHEFRTPLTLILGPIADLAAGNDARPAVDRERIELVHRNSLRLLKLVNTLLDFSRIEAGRTQAVYRPTDLATLTADLASAFRSAIERAGMALIVDCPPLSEPAYVDRDMWEKIVLNLVSNAFKYTPEGEIRVSLRRVGSSIALTVADTGVGIPKHELPHLFERFHRVEGIKGRTHEGTGIGLALVQELARLHGGTSGVESLPGAGSTFTVTIPSGSAHLPADRVDASGAGAVSSLGATPYVEEALRWLPEGGDETGISVETASPAASRAAVTADAKRPQVLLADDNADMRSYLERLLCAQYDVEAVADGSAALAAARLRRPDLVLADVMMPSLDGFGLLRELRADSDLSAVPVVLLSARAGEEARVEGWSAGADDYLVKPFSARELLARVESHLNLARVRRDSEAALRASEEKLQRSLESEQHARAEAQRANRMKDEFLSTLSHELRTPLNAILGWSQFLADDAVRSPERLEKGLETIERNARAQVNLIEDLLDVSRISEGKLRLEVKAVAFAEVVEAALATIRPAADARQISVQIVLDRNNDRVTGDPARLQQIVWNLLSNAVKFTPKGGKIQVGLERVESHIALSVSDNGEGIRPEFLPHVFDRFRQGDQSTTRSFGGLGLGLSIVKHLVELHGGSVRAMSEGPGRGTTFVVDLPLRMQQQSEAGTAAARDGVESPGMAASQLDGVTVLYVDDEPDARELAHRVLGRHGARVLTAGSAKAGRQSVTEHRPDVIVADIGMPEEDGYSLIRAIRALPADRGGTTPAAAVTALARPEDRRRALMAGFQTHVSKPVDMTELVAVVASLAGRTGR
jgi:signal transduction histidine kinase